ncbi:hypothetical protein [Rhodococcus marinonascens]|uniref:hypothetical protein n=1 Tax=Rhodococcus marinonascens TaxID=38311 RepID=UPI000AC0D63C|nr:hypothetical protein [Rhodococcus marinonascens]
MIRVVVFVDIVEDRLIRLRPRTPVRAVGAGILLLLGIAGKRRTPTPAVGGSGMSSASNFDPQGAAGGVDEGAGDGVARVRLPTLVDIGG